VISRVPQHATTIPEISDQWRRLPATGRGDWTIVKRDTTRWDVVQKLSCKRVRRTSTASDARHARDRSPPRLKRVRVAPRRLQLMPPWLRGSFMTQACRASVSSMRSGERQPTNRLLYMYAVSSRRRALTIIAHSNRVAAIYLQKTYNCAHLSDQFKHWHHVTNEDCIVCWAAAAAQCIGGKRISC